MTFLSSTSRLIPGMMSLGVLGRAVSTVPKKWGPGMKKPKMLGPFTEVMFGTAMIKPVSSMVSAL